MAGSPGPEPTDDGLSEGRFVAGLAAAAPSRAGEAGVAVDAAIVCRGLVKHFGTIKAVDGLDMEVPVGSIYGFLGPNGAGKTTTIRMLVGLARPTAGAATVAGVSIGRGTLDLGHRIGYLDQDPRYYGWMRGRELLELTGRLYGLGSLALRQRVSEVLELVGLEEAADRKVGGYSGGMHQRLGIGQAILGNPSVIFLDEPASSLDPEGRRDVLEIIARLRGLATVVLSTHILNDVERVCDTVAIIDQGRLVAQAGLHELLNEYARPVYRIEVDAGLGDGAMRIAAALRDAPWTRQVAHDALSVTVNVSDPEVAGREILGRVAATGVPVAVLERMRPSLEDVFLELVGEDAAERARQALGEESARPKAAPDGPPATTPPASAARPGEGSRP